MGAEVCAWVWAAGVEARAAGEEAARAAEVRASGVWMAEVPARTE